MIKGKIECCYIPAEQTIVLFQGRTLVWKVSSVL